MSEDPMIADVRAVLEEYFTRLDQRRFADAAGCFALDAQTEYGGIALAPGREAVHTYLETALTPTLSTRHLATGFDIRIDGPDAAAAETIAIAYVVRAGTPGPELQIRGIGYLDRLQRVEKSWKITSRVHRVDWVSTVAVELPAAGQDALVRSGARS